MILITNEQTAIPVDLKQLEADAKIILKALDYEHYDLGILLTTDAVIHEYNKKYRNHDKPTDILSFAYHPELKAGERIKPKTDDDKNVGDIVLAPRYIKNDLERWGQTFEERMKVLLVHGICHLLGYDHIEDADYEVMHQQEVVLLEKIK